VRMRCEGVVPICERWFALENGGSDYTTVLLTDSMGTTIYSNERAWGEFFTRTVYVGGALVVRAPAHKDKATIRRAASGPRVLAVEWHHEAAAQLEELPTRNTPAE